MMFITAVFYILIAAAASGQATLLEGSFTTQLDHSRPQDPTTVTFVCVLFNSFLIQNKTRAFIRIRDILQISSTTIMVDRFTLTSRMPETQLRNGLKTV